MGGLKILQALVVFVFAAGPAIPVAQADDHEWKYSSGHGGKYGGENRGKPLVPAQVNAKYKKECSDCHIAYAPGLMSAESWRRIMAHLDKHFGTDASLYAQDNKEITDYLAGYASNRWSAPTAPLRITEAAWFKRKHDSHEIPPRVWQNPKVKSAANCEVCHPRAEYGDFDEHGVVLPQ